MALALTEIQAITDDYWEAGSVDIFFTDNVLLFKLMGRGQMEVNFVHAGELADGGDNIRVVLEYAESNSGTYGATTSISQAKTDIFNAARFRWAGYYSSNTIDLDDKRKNAGDAAKVMLVQGKLKNIEKTIRKKMGADIYASAADSDAFLGLGNLFNTTTSTAYGQIAEDDMAVWKANVLSDNNAISFAELQYIRRTASIGQAVSDKPNLYMTTDVLKDAFEASLQAQVRYQDTDMADAGFDNVLFKGAPVVADDNQAAGHCDALNLNYIKVKTHASYAFTRPVWEHDKDKPDLEVSNVRYSGQLVCSNRKAHCRYDDLTAA